MDLINSISDVAATTIYNGDVIGLDNFGLTLSNMNIQAVTCGTGIGSVKFALDSNLNFRMENSAAYAMCGNSGTNYSGCTSTQLGLGVHVVTATMYSGSSGSGTVLSKQTVNFTIAQSATPGPAPPIPTLPPTPVPLSSSPVTLPPAQVPTPAPVVLMPVPALTSAPIPITAPPGPVTGVLLMGDLRKWHKITLVFPNGPSSSESADPNPFTDYRLDVTFTNGNLTYLMPGFYAADGNAAETSASSGSVWQCNFAPSMTGTWTWQASFLSGSNVAMEWPLVSGTPTAFHGVSGFFVIDPTNKSGRDLRGKGMLQYVRKHHLQFRETGEYFLKAGVDRYVYRLVDAYDYVCYR